MDRGYSPPFFLELGTDLKNRNVSSSNAINQRRFKAWYGIDWTVMSVVWNILRSIGWMKILKRSPNPEHLLWALSFFKLYKTEEEHAADVGKEPKTFRKWAWFYAEGIAASVNRVVSVHLKYFTIIIILNKILKLTHICSS